ncbi:MAG: RsmE family RNA methyltransferase [Bacteroidota bacterium]
MNCPYFYVPRDRIRELVGGGLILDGDEYRHLRSSLRKRIGDIIEVTDGTGWIYLAKIKAFSKGSALCTVLEAREEKPQLQVQLSICLGLLHQPARFDVAVEKLTELGASKIVPLITERSVISPKAGRVNRWKGIAISALKQSRRTILPVIDEPRPLTSILQEGNPHTLQVVLHEKASSEATLTEIIRSAFRREEHSELRLFIGPEGGFSDDEIRTMQLVSRVHIASLGEFRLRSETAAIVAAAIALQTIEEIYAKR